MNPPTPWPPDMATGENPPDGAIIDYYLGAEVLRAWSRLKIVDSKGEVDRARSTATIRFRRSIRGIRTRRCGRGRRVCFAATPGHHRFLWDMQYPQVPGMSTGPDADEAVPHDTPAVSSAPWVMPGTLHGQADRRRQDPERADEGRMDPRVKTRRPISSSSSRSRRLYERLLQATAAIHEITVLREQLKARRPGSLRSLGSTDALEAKLRTPDRGGGGGGVAAEARGGAAVAATLNTVRTHWPVVRTHDPERRCGSDDSSG